MEFTYHSLIFIFSGLTIWFFAGIFIDSIDKISKRSGKTNFAVAFFVLGILTSISEISVAINSSLENVPQISAGNLIGASFVLMFLVIPLLAIAGKGIDLKSAISNRTFVISLLVISLPYLNIVITGSLTKAAGFVAVAGYFFLVMAIFKENRFQKIESIDPSNQKINLTLELIKILIGGAAILIAGKFLVDETIFFAQKTGVPASFIGLLVLSIGTNLPELVIAIRSIFKKHKDIAFGDYIGSAASNTLIFGTLLLANGPFPVRREILESTAELLIPGLSLLYFFGSNDRKLSRKEGFILLSIYGIFLLLQVFNIPSLIIR